MNPQRTPRLGLIVNPIAGMGGRVGLKGTDGDELLRLAVARGAVPMAESRAALCLEAFLKGAEGRPFELHVGPGAMGERVAERYGLGVVVAGRGALPPPSSVRTTAEDTRRTARNMADTGVDLLLFAGGDGTARDICVALGRDRLVLGIPAGVKIHSAVYASSPAAAGFLAAATLFGDTSVIREKLAEVMDIDEDAYRSGVLRAKLLGYLRIPYERRRVQGLKAGSGTPEAAAQAEIAAAVAETISAGPETLWLIGAGTTTKAVTDALGLSGTLLGVDACLGGSLIALDLSERDILALIAQQSDPKKIKILLTPIGGQGFLFGRGNQQFSPDVIRAVGRENLMILATPDKLHTLRGAPLLADTGDPSLDLELEGYYRIVSSYGGFTVYPLAAAGQ